MGDFLVYFIGKIIESARAISKVAEKKASEINASSAVHDSANDNDVDNRSARTFDELVDDTSNDRYAYEEMDYDGHNEDINT